MENQDRGTGRHNILDVEFEEVTVPQEDSPEMATEALEDTAQPVETEQQATKSKKTGFWTKLWRIVKAPFLALWLCVAHPKQAIYNIKKGFYYTIDFLKMWYKATIKQAVDTTGIAILLVGWLVFLGFMINMALTAKILLLATMISVVLSIPSWIYFYKNVYKSHLNIYRTPDGRCIKMEQAREQKLNRMQIEVDMSIQVEARTKQDALDVAQETEELKSQLHILTAQIKRVRENAANLFEMPTQPQIEM